MFSDKLLEEMRQKKIVRTPIPIVQEPEQPADIGKESNPRDSIWSISSSESAESKQEQPGDKCTSKRKKRKKKVSAVSDSFNFMGQNLNLLFSAFK